MIYQGNFLFYLISIWFMTANTSTTTRLPKRKVYTEFFDFCPGYKRQQAEYKKTIVTEVDPKSRKKSQEPMTWPYQKSTDESVYEGWVERVTNKKNQFNPQKDEDNRTIPNTGAYRTIRSITRLKRADDSEWLLTKSDLIGFDSLGEEVRLHVSTSCDKWTKPNFIYKKVWNQNTSQLDKQLKGPAGSETVYEVPFTKENLQELYNQRESDRTIQFICKEEQTGNSHMVRDVTGNTQKSYELFRDSDFDFLFKGDFIPPAIKEEMRQAALAEGLIGGSNADYGTAKQPPSNSKNLYK
jgi:hypothetical protein